MASLLPPASLTGSATSNSPAVATMNTSSSLASNAGSNVTTANPASQPDQKISTLVAKIPPQTAKRAVSTLSQKPPGACYGSLVTVEIGPEKKVFAIHKDLLTFYSDYFRGAFGGSFKEAVEARISLPDERVDVFDVVNQFLYTHSLADGEGHNIAWDNLVRIWLFADKYLIPTLQNSAMDAMIKKNKLTQETPTTEIGVIWRNTLSASVLRKFVLDHAVHKLNMDKSMSPAYEGRWPREALLDLVRAFYHKEVVSGQCKLPKRDRCYYHIHHDGEKCD